MADTTAPLIDGSARLQFIAVPLLLYLVLLSRGFAAMTAEALNVWAAFWAIIWALPVFLLWNMIGAIFKVRQQEAELGEWFGNRFIYHDAVRVLTARISPEDNGKPRTFRVKSVPRECLVELSAVVEQGAPRFTIRVGHTANADALWPDLPNDSRLTIRVPPNKRFYLFVEALPSSSPQTLKLYLHSWIIGNS